MPDLIRIDYVPARTLTALQKVVDRSQRRAWPQRGVDALARSIELAVPASLAMRYELQLGDDLTPYRFAPSPSPLFPRRTGRSARFAAAPPAHRTPIDPTAAVPDPTTPPRAPRSSPRSSQRGCHASSLAPQRSQRARPQRACASPQEKYSHAPPR